jgi:hypothetical protein
VLTEVEEPTEGGKVGGDALPIHRMSYMPNSQNVLYAKIRSLIFGKKLKG